MVHVHAGFGVSYPVSYKMFGKVQTDLPSRHTELATSRRILYTCLSGVLYHTRTFVSFTGSLRRVRYLPSGRGALAPSRRGFCASSCCPRLHKLAVHALREAGRQVT